MDILDTVSVVEEIGYLRSTDLTRLDDALDDCSKFLERISLYRHQLRDILRLQIEITYQLSPTTVQESNAELITDYSLANQSMQTTDRHTPPSQILRDSRGRIKAVVGEA